MHFYDRNVPTAPEARPIPGHFDVAMYRDLQRRLGLQRVVVVQPNSYLFDNRVTMAAMAELGAQARGVAVVDESVSDAELERMTRAGVCAQRIFELPFGAVGLAQMAAIMARVHPFGWHANVQLDGRILAQVEAQLLRLPGNFVIDHTGKFLEPVSVDAPAFKALLRLVDSGRCWVKLSAPYETSRAGAPRYEDVARLATALVAHAPERMLWASNWPHPSAREAPPDDAALLDLLLDWAPKEADRQRILADNPAQLYGF